MNKRSWKLNALLVLSLVAIVTLLAPSTRAEDQIRIELDEPFELDGHVYAAGTVMLRHVSAFNPTATLHEVWVDRECLGVVIARQVESEGRADDHAMLFSRNHEHRLVLIGMTYRGEPAMAFHRIGDTLHRTNVRPSAGPLMAVTQK